MKKLSKIQKDARDKIVENLSVNHEDLKKVIEAFNEARETAWNKLTAEALEANGGSLTAALEAFNETQSEAWKPVAEALDDYNHRVEDANGFQEEIVSEMDSYRDERSEKWQEGDAGESYSSWMEEWQEEFEEMELDEQYPLPTDITNLVDYDYDPVEVPENTAGEELEARPEEPS